MKEIIGTSVSGEQELEYPPGTNYLIQCKCIHSYIALYDSIYEHKVSDVNVSIVKQYSDRKGKIIACDLRLAASQLRIVSITQPLIYHTLTCHYIIHLCRCRPLRQPKPKQ